MHTEAMTGSLPYSKDYSKRDEKSLLHWRYNRFKSLTQMVGDAREKSSVSQSGGIAIAPADIDDEVVRRVLESWHEQGDSFTTRT